MTLLTFWKKINKLQKIANMGIESKKLIYMMLQDEYGIV